MKTPEEMAAYFRAMPKKKIEPNPYWKFEVCTEDTVDIKAIQTGTTTTIPFDLNKSKRVLNMVREFFRRYYESFHSESQVLCVTPEDGTKLAAMAIPRLGYSYLGPFEVDIMVLPQDNHMGTSVISEWFWQNRIVGAGIKPIARIHSHHILEPCQSITDYSTLNSGTLEMVIGKINEENLKVCYWLDVPGTDTKAQTFLATECEDGTFTTVPHIFHGQESKEIIKNENCMEMP